MLSDGLGWSQMRSARPEMSRKPEEEIDMRNGASWAAEYKIPSWTLRNGLKLQSAHVLQLDTTPVMFFHSEGLE